MTTIAEVRDGMAYAITKGCGLRCLSYVADTIPAPCAVISREEMDPRMVFGKASAVYNFNVRVFVGRVAEKASQKKLDTLTEATGTGSLVAAVEDDTNWPSDVTVQYASVTRIGVVPQTAAVADETFLSVDFDIEVVF